MTFISPISLFIFPSHQERGRVGGRRGPAGSRAGGAAAGHRALRGGALCCGAAGVAATGEGAKDGKITREWWVYGDFMDFYGDLMGIYGDFNGNLMGFDGSDGDLMGFH